MQDPHTPDMLKATKIFNELEKNYKELLNKYQKGNTELLNKSNLEAEIQQKDTVIHGQKQMLESQDKMILKMQDDYDKQGHDALEIQRSLNDLKLDHKIKSDKIKDLEIENLGLKKERENLSGKIEKLESDIKKLEDIKAQYKTTMGLLKTRDDKIAELEKKLESAKKEIADVEKAVS